MPKKKFINKKNAVTFQLVHRSQKDPLIADETASQHVLVPKNSVKDKNEEHKYGIYFDDDYNYLQHLRDVNNVEYELVPTLCTTKEDAKINLPSSAFASAVEEEVGLLNKAAPESGLRLDLDPDVVAAMDDDFDYSDPENELEDDFIDMANQSPTESEHSEVCSEDDNASNYSNEVNDELCSLNSFGKEETMSRFTEYSMSSSVISRNSQLTQLDETFEQMFAEYDDTEIGALECDEIEGDIDSSSQLFKTAYDEFEKAYKKNGIEITSEENSAVEKMLYEENEDSSDDDKYFIEVKEKRDKWDCESILSTYSNLYNHPKVIAEPRVNCIKIDKRTGIPVECGKLTKKALAQLDDTSNQKGPSSVISTFSMLSLRDKNETPDEKKNRKRMLKEYRRVRRLERKANTKAFTEEKIKLENTMIHNKLKCQGVRLE